MQTLLLLLGLTGVVCGRPVLGWTLVIAAALGWWVDQRIAAVELRGEVGLDDGVALGTVGFTCAALVAIGAFVMGV